MLLSMDVLQLADIVEGRLPKSSMLSLQGGVQLDRGREREREEEERMQL